MADVKYTNTGLVKHAEKALALKTKYMWGGLLREITLAYIAQLRNMYKTNVGTGYTENRYKELQAVAGKGYYGVDCIGLIKSYYWSGKTDGGTGSPKYCSTQYPDVNAGMMYSAAKVKGKISTMPEVPGLIVYSKSHPHVGIYIGNGYTIESTLGSRGDGVVKRKLDSFWEYWFECPYIQYGSGNSAAKEVLTGCSEKKCKVLFPATVRDSPSNSGKKLGKYSPGDTVTIVTGTETTDRKSGYKYVRISGDTERWIVKSAIG